ncbi:ClpP class serine protease [Pedobacter sp. AK013]|uniref:hypothetical protein n=1 Tax=Pedobacter sp. AK013 TaxID=2723071 RepID=UPI00160811F9|nr:hypothetical protein [Pedobacter sp. AK013]MBB6236499.1 ClpP class serine protease [Pedobacter sp. AK013]
MNVALAREVYGFQPWMVEGDTFAALMFLLKNGDLNRETSLERANSISLYDTKSAVTILTRTYELNQDANGNDLIYVLNLNGVITKNGGMSSYGMKELSSQLLKFDADSRVKGGVIIVDSGGGSSLGMELMKYTLQTRKKPIVGLIERAGMAASAALGIISETDWVMAEDENSQIGSAGTMLAFSGHANKAIDGDGAKHVTIYATKSIKKNKAYEEAVNNDNYEIAINEILDPANEIFLNGLKKARPGILDSQLDGSMYNAGNVIGSLVDQIGSFEDAVNKVLELSAATEKVNNNNPKNNNQKTKAMTAQEFLQQHPAAHAEIFNAGVAAEQERVGVWMAHFTTDPEAVKAGIESKKPLDGVARENFLIKASSKDALSKIKSDSAVTIKTPEAAEPVKTEADSFYENV